MIRYSKRPNDRFAAEPSPHGDVSKPEVEKLPHRRERHADPLSDGTDTGAYATIRNNPRPMRHRKLFIDFDRGQGFNVPVAQRLLAKGVPSALSDTAVIGDSEKSRRRSVSDTPSNPPGRRR
jgi:hypothetical protein